MTKILLNYSERFFSVLSFLVSVKMWANRFSNKDIIIIYKGILNSGSIFENEIHRGSIIMLQVCSLIIKLAYKPEPGLGESNRLIKMILKEKRGI